MKPTTPETEESPEIDPTIVALGGVEISVTHTDGREEMVKVRILEVEHFADYISRSMRERDCADYVCAKMPGWSKTLNTDSILTINEKASELNFSSALRWAQRRAAITEKLTPLYEKGPVASFPSASSARK
jgi:hypothetical protein